MKPGYFQLIYFIALTSSIFPQIEPGAKQIALSHSDVALSSDVFTLFGNPAGLSEIKWREAGVYYSPAPFGFSEMANGYIAYNEPFNWGSIAIGGMSYGFDLYKENKILLGFSYNLLDKFFLGAVLNFHTVSIKTYGSANSFYLNLGGLAYITEVIRWGFSIQNVNRASFGKEKDQIPVVFRTGFSYDVMKNISLNASVEKDVIHNTALLVGINYDLVKYFSIRTGFSNEPSSLTAGIGINYSLISVDYAVFTHPDLGLTHQAGIIISFKPEGK